ncbi:hypothetical protein BV20DRAFT_166516 [Pilatotrama ljubarskyi]|nr:hypothetical protein BV20DRAFT_166516 [Pilatotrama ljubarskyi]
MTFQQQTFNNALPTVAFAGFVGGDASASAHTASYLYGRRNVPALYNSPGSYELGKRILALLQSRFWDGLHAGASLDPDAFARTTPTLSGPKFVATFSGTQSPTTGEPARILLEHCRNRPIDTAAQGRVTSPYAVTVVDLHHVPASEVHPTLKAAAPFLPILASIGASAGCALVGDWHVFSMIALGMFCNAATSTVLRASDLTFSHPTSAPGAPAGDGFLEAGNEIVVLKGSEDAVNAITRGRFSVRFSDEQSLRRLSTCATLCTLQGLAHLLVVPHGTVLGQLFFLLSLAVAWLYNSSVASVEKNAKAQVVMEDLLQAPSMKRYSLGTRTAMAVFLVQVLKPADVEEQLAALIPNKTRVWTAWRQIVARRLAEGKPIFDSSLPAPTEAAAFTKEESTLMRTLLGDAQAAVNVYASARAHM